MQYHWLDEDGSVISCVEKNKMLNENIAEISQNIKDAYEDAILMGVSKENFLQNFERLLANVVV